MGKSKPINLGSDDIIGKTPPKAQSYYVTDTVEGKLKLKVHPSGKRTYHYDQGVIHGVRKRPSLAGFKETTVSIMRKKVREYNNLASNDINPFSEDLSKLTLTMFLEDIFMPEKQMPSVGADGTRHGVSEREYKNRMSMINAHIRGGIGKMLLKDMSYMAVEAFFRKVEQKTATQARNIRVFLIDAWKEALRRFDNLQGHPNYFQMIDVKRLNKAIRQKAKDKRPLNQEEGTAIYNAIQNAIEEEPFIARCIKLISLLAVRKMDAMNLKFEDIQKDKTSGQLYFSAYNDKGGEDFIFFGENSSAVLDEIKKLHKEKSLVAFKYVFPKIKHDRYVDEPITDGMVRTVFEGSGHGIITGILGEAGKEAPTLLGTNKIPKFTLHNFRHTTSSQLEGRDAQLALGHKNASTTEEHYKKTLKSDLAANAPKREAAIISVFDGKGR